MGIRSPASSPGRTVIYSGASAQALERDQARLAQLQWIVPDAAELAAAMDRSRRDNDFIDAHFDELHERYGERWIAVCDGTVVGYGKNARGLLTRLVSRGVPTDGVSLRYMQRTPETLIL